MCTASHWVKLLTAAFAAEYAGMLVSGRKAFMDEMLMMLPLPFSTITLPNTWDARNVPRKFRLNTHCTASGGRSKKGCSGVVVACFLLPPAPLMRMSTVPHFSSTASRAASSDSRLRTSAFTAIASPPAATMSSTTFCAASGKMSSTATLTPAFARARLMAPHSTPPPPVTTATCPLTSNIFSMYSPTCLTSDFLTQRRQEA